MTALEKAQLAWGAGLPDWVMVLASACDTTTQSEVTSRVPYSAATLSYVIANKYKGDLGKVEQAVRGALMGKTVLCPLVGELATDTCLGHQRAKWAPHNPQRIAFWKACRSGCPHSRLGVGR